MKKAFFIIYIISIFTSYSQADTTKVSFISYWSIGDSYNFKVSKIKQQWKKGVQTKNDSTQYIANFKVIDSTENSYTIKWVYNNNLINTYKVPEELAQSFSKYNFTEVVYKTTELGEFIEVENWEEIGKFTKALLSDLVDALGNENDQSIAELKKGMQPIINIYSSKQGIEQIVLKELQYFHFPFGLEYNILEPIEYTEEIPNMLGGEPIRGEAKLFFKDVDFDNEHCALIQQMKLNPEDTKNVILQLLKKMGLKGKEMSAAMKTAQFDIMDNNRFEYYYYPGIPTKIQTIRTSIIDVNNEKGKRIDKTIIELVD